MYSGSNSFFEIGKQFITSLQQAYSFSKSQNPDLVFLIKAKIIADLQDAGKALNEKQ